jgi:hypothetical protein
MEMVLVTEEDTDTACCVVECGLVDMLWYFGCLIKRPRTEALCEDSDSSFSLHTSTSPHVFHCSPALKCII